MSTINTNLTARLRQGRQKARQKHKDYEVTKRGTLRAGNSGIMSVTGEVAGSCQRLAHLRSLGVDVEEPSDSTLIMFQMGTANEDVVYQDLLHTKADDEIILREEEIPISWMTSSGVTVTGRPDMVVCRRHFTEVTQEEADALNGSGPQHMVAGVQVETSPDPVFGVEIKSVASVWTSREVLFEGHPKIEHLIQAAHYSWKLGCPFRLLYKQYTNQALPSWASKFFPKHGEAHSQHIEYNEKGEIKNITPFEIAYELQFDRETGVLQYRREDYPEDTAWKTTLIKVADIERFYEFTARMGDTQILGPRPLTIDPHGKEKNFSKCSYCSLNSVCTSAEERQWSYWEWLAAATAPTMVKDSGPLQESTSVPGASSDTPSDVSAKKPRRKKT